MIHPINDLVAKWRERGARAGVTIFTGNHELLVANELAAALRQQREELLELAATFETCIPFLPPVGRRNITAAVARLRSIA